MNAIATATVLQESEKLDFKAEFDPSSSGAWCEIIKDIVAMANSGGGKIWIGVDDDGHPNGYSIQAIVDTDLAQFVDKLYRYTGIHFAGVIVRTTEYIGSKIAEIEIQEVSTPLIFITPGCYPGHEGKEKTAFRQGTLYVRHGPKSETATSDDLHNIIQRSIARDRQSLMGNLRQVIEAPANSIVSIGVARNASAVSQDAPSAVRIVDDTSAPIAYMLDPNNTHPNRQKEIIGKINTHFNGTVKVTSNDIVAIRRLYNTDSAKKYYYRPKTGCGQYSDAFAQWIIGQIEADNRFLENLRQRYHDYVVGKNIERMTKRYL